MDLPNGTPVTITPNDKNITDVAWSPDGTRIICLAVPVPEQAERTELSPEPAPPDPEQWLLTIDTAKLDTIQSLTRVKDWARYHRAFRVESLGKISPDGRWLAFRGSENRIGIIDFAQQHVGWAFSGDVTRQHFPDSPSGMSLYQWLPDSRTLLITSGGLNRRVLWAATVEGECRILKEDIMLWGNTPDGRKVLVYGGGKMWWATLEVPVTSLPSR